MPNGPTLLTSSILWWDRCRMTLRTRPFEQAAGNDGRVRVQGSDSTGLVSLPIFSISTDTLSPGLSQRGGFAAIPTP